MFILAFRSVRRSIPGATTFALLLIAVGLWCVLYGGEILVSDLHSKLIFAAAEYVGIGFIPVLWLMFGLRYTGLDGFLKRWTIVLLLSVPTLTLAVAATNWLHHLLWLETSVVDVAGIHALVLTHGPYFWIHMVYSYTVMAAGTVVLASFVVRQPPAYRIQTNLIMLASFVPWILNMAYVLGFRSVGSLDLTPFGFAFTGAIFAVAMSRFRLLDLFVGLEARGRSLIIETMPDGYVVLDADDHVMDHNPAALELLRARSAEELEARMLEILAHCPCPLPETSPAQASPDEEVELAFDGDEAGCKRTFDVLASPLHAADGGTAARLVLVRDVTERKNVERAARDSERRYKALVDNAHDLIFTVDTSGVLTSVNPAVEAVTGYSMDDLIRAEASLPGGIASMVKVKELPELDPGARRQEIRITSKDGRDIVLEASVHEVVVDGRSAGQQYIARDVTESRQWEEALKFQALHDSITNLPNRFCFRERAAEALGGSATKNRMYALCALDLDNFKDVNDDLGHDLGDRVLEVAARRLSHALRTGDLLARMGGDEFAMLLQVDDVEDARRAAHRILNSLTGPCQVEGRVLSLSTSIGVALFPQHGTTVDMLLRVADIAMYRAKQAGGARYALHEVGGDPDSPERLSLQAELMAAFARGELTVYYQPVVDLRRDGAPAFEALVRWNHPVRGLILPSEFLALLEQEGMGDKLGKWVLDKVLVQLVRWRSRGFDARVSVNLSARSLDDPGLVEWVGGLIEKHGAASEWLMLELTEGSVMLDPERSIRALSGIRDLGINVAIDDFGSGQASLAHLRALPADVLKIDRSYITNMTVDKNDAAIVRSAVGLARELGLQVIGAGIEDRATLRLLRAYGCDFGQGYFLGRPNTARAISRSLRSDSWHTPVLEFEQ
jgi:diguanylate cyclase (GGDEF)-like protein/PAS domain S-box-containing protein